VRNSVLPPAAAIKSSDFASHKVLTKSFCTSRFPHKSINLFSVLVMIKDKLTDLCGNCLLQNGFLKTFCELRLASEVGMRAMPLEPVSTKLLARLSGKSFV